MQPELTVSFLGLIILITLTVMAVNHKNRVKTADVLVMSLVYLPINTFLLSQFWTRLQQGCCVRLGCQNMPSYEGCITLTCV